MKSSLSCTGGWEPLIAGWQSCCEGRWQGWGIHSYSLTRAPARSSRPLGKATPAWACHTTGPGRSGWGGGSSQGPGSRRTGAAAADRQCCQDYSSKYCSFVLLIYQRSFYLLSAASPGRKMEMAAWSGVTVCGAGPGNPACSDLPAK